MFSFSVVKKSFKAGAALIFILCAAPLCFAQSKAQPAAEIKEIEGFVRINDIDPAIVLDLRYATKNNFTGKKVYPAAVGLLRRTTAEKLAAANSEFKKDGYRIKVWDGYRPLSVQKIFWEIVPDDRYVANPYKGGSKHNRGGAVDITLIDSEGQELEMPSAFDDFSEKAKKDNPLASNTARQNAEYLARVMEKNGFAPYAHEWWHFDDKDWEGFPVADVSFEKFLEVAPQDHPAILDTLSVDTKQALVVSPFLKGDFRAEFSAWERKEGRWEKVFKDIKASVGKNGLAPQGKKMEGDGRTPSGIFKIGTAFGYASRIPTGLSYRQAKKNDFWVDDAASPDYNRWVTGKPNAKSFERLKREDDLYKLAAVIEYNTDPIIPGHGSAIFLHIWRAQERPTAGCVAISEKDMARILKWLNKGLQPVIVMF